MLTAEESNTPEGAQRVSAPQKEQTQSPVHISWPDLIRSPNLSCRSPGCPTSAARSAGLPGCLLGQPSHPLCTRALMLTHMLTHTRSLTLTCSLTYSGSLSHTIMLRHTRPCSLLHACAHTHVLMLNHVHSHILSHMYSHTCSHIHAHAHTHTCSHIHTLSLSWCPPAPPGSSVA